ncbi:MAG: hypothetical protein AAB391_02925 [Patescibacteria group bacterium]
MKLKATAHAGLPESLLNALNEIRPKVVRGVLAPHLKVSLKIGPAEFFVQQSDLADAATHEFFVHVGLSGVSLNNERSNNDFTRALEALVALYKHEIVTCKDLAGTEKLVQLFVVIYLDGKHPVTGSSLIESKAEWVSVE